MKPIILVIIGAAILMPVINHKHNANNATTVHTEKNMQKVEIKHETETNVHSISYWLDRLP